MHSAPPVRDRGSRIVAHAAGSGLVLAAADAQGGGALQIFTAPLACSHSMALCRINFRGFQRLRVRRSGEPGDRKSEPVAYRWVDRNPAVRTWNVLDGPHDLYRTAVAIAHPVFVLLAPSGNIPRMAPIPEDDRQLDKLVGEHPAPDYARVPVAELTCRDRDPGPLAIVELFVKEPCAPG